MRIRKILPVTVLLTITSALVGLALFSNEVFAADSYVDNIGITVPTSCSIGGTVNTEHTATLQNGTYSASTGSDYENGIGKTTLTVFCNDNNGFSVYAIGYTGDEDDGINSTKLVGINTGSTINTKVYSSGDTASNWSMKVNKVADSTISHLPNNMSITNSYDNWHIVPNLYEQVATYKAETGSSVTDTTMGAKLETTYAAYISSTQPADTYQGKVKYVLVHPFNEEPLQPQTAISGCINYFANTSTAIGSMGCQEIAASDTSATLYASNFSREGYGFAGWSDTFDYATNPNAHFYGPQEDITFAAGQYTGDNDGLALYAVWIKSAGNLQDRSKVAELCGTSSTNGSLTAASYDDKGDADESTWSITAGLSSVSALTDTRDNQTYAIAKLTDGNCWMIENLRLADTHQEGANTVATILTTTNTNSPLNNGTDVTLKHNYTDTTTSNTLSATSSEVYNADSAPSGWCNGQTADCIYQSRLRTDNTTNRVSYTTISTAMSTDANLYSYGNYYNWYSATAGNIRYDENSYDTTGDLCPAGWHLPRSTAGFQLLTNSLGGYSGGIVMNSSTTPTVTIMLERIRHFPNNFIYSGFVYGASLSWRGQGGYYWTSYATTSSEGSYRVKDLLFISQYIYPGTYYNQSMTRGETVRCLASPSM